MSMGAYRWALGWVDLKSSDKFVLVMIADHYNDEAHRSWPSIKRLAMETQLSERTVIRSIKFLAEHEVIEIEPWVHADTGKSLTNRYCLPMYDKKSRAAKNLPVRAWADFDPVDGKITYDTMPHQFKSGEEVPGYAA
ncbi:helix-turn-helix domain-containing protein [Leucobacter tenebrionis]|uniref:helix-turn-helix domain-containing protein n=1 Tax=Leucobacter tenebrionis TaxID=2873270 RepID=UPI001CA776D9|nr:helix-turn-helix domain-containing protein [Leucobacter tenebrionis]QZY52715.1 helix-turn-helix domain-containing protein [Leucobacter tenebrionis]